VVTSEQGQLLIEEVLTFPSPLNFAGFAFVR